MSKFSRSLLWSGLVVAGVAACGDDVTVTPPPPPPTPTVHSISVGPTGVTISVGQTLQMSAAVNADAGVATTVTWSLPAGTTAATINSTSGVLTAVSAGAVSPTACSTAVPTVCGNATVTITGAPTPTVTQITLSPATPNVTRPATGTTTLQFTAAVAGTNNPPQSPLTWSLPGGAITGVTLSSTGLLTISANTPGGTFNVTACSQLTGFTNVCGSAAVTVLVPTPATVSISAVNWVPPVAAPTNCTPSAAPIQPVILTAVSCQIEVTANVNAGDQQLTRLDILIGGQVVASQTFPGTVAAEGETPAVSAPVDITMSINTLQLRRPAGSTTLFVPVIFNGNQQITANLYTTVSGATPLASNAFPIVMANADMAIVQGAGGGVFTLVNNSSSPSFTTGGVTFFTGTQTAGTINYVSFSTQVPTALSFTSTVCGASNSNAITGTATTGITITGTFNCANVEGNNSLTGAALPPTYAAGAIGPDNTPVIGAAFFSNVGTGFSVPTGPTTTELRWNPTTPTAIPPVAGQLRGVDNKAPVVTVQGTGTCASANGGKVAFNDSFDQCWINATYSFLSDIGATDGGTGVASRTAWFLAVGGVSCAAATIDVTAVAPGTGVLVETVTSDGTPEGHRICASAADNIGNVSAKVGPSNFFGVDVVAPSVRLAGSTAATPTLAPLTAATVSSVANTTIYGDGAGPLSGTQPVMPPTDAWGLEAQDTRSGFSQVAVGAFPATQTLSRLAVSGATSCAAFGAAGPLLPTALSDTWVRSAAIVNTVDCGLGIGYYNYTGFVTDRAGNSSGSILRNFAQDHLAAPTLASIGATTPLYTAGASAAFFVFGSDDLEIIEGDITMSYPNLGLVTATIEGITYPLSQINGTNPGVRWDNLLNNIVTAGTITVGNLLGRVDFTCTGAAAPYAGCLVADGITPTAAQFNTVNGTDDGQSPDSVRAVAYDVASNASNSVASGLLSIQTSDVAQQWVGADLITWSVISTAGTTVVARHMASTSITAPYFDSVLLARADAGATELRVCGTFPAPLLTDNGLNRFWTYTIAKPTGSAQCAAGGNWYAIGLKGAAALVTQGLP